MTHSASAALTFSSLLSPHLHGFYTELLALLSPDVGMDLRLAHPDWQDARRAVETATVDGAFQCGLILQRHQGFVPVAAPVSLGQTEATYTTRVVVRRESAARRFEDLDVARWTYNDPSSLSGYSALHAHAAQLALPPEFFGVPFWSGGHLASLDAVLTGRTDAAGIDSTVYISALRSRPGLRQRLRVVTSLGPYPAPPLALSRTLPKALQDQVQAAMLALHTHARGQALLHQAGFSRFLAVSTETYQPLLEVADRAERWRTALPTLPTPQRFAHA